MTSPYQQTERNARKFMWFIFWAALLCGGALSAYYLWKMGSFEAAATSLNNSDGARIVRGFIAEIKHYWENR